MSVHLSVSVPVCYPGSALAASVCKKITGRLTSAIAKQEDVSVQLEALDIMADMLCRYRVSFCLLLCLKVCTSEFTANNIFSVFVSVCLQTGRSAGQLPPLHPQLPAPSAHLPQAGRQKGASLSPQLSRWTLVVLLHCDEFTAESFRGRSWLWDIWWCLVGIWSSSIWSSTFWPSWGGTTTCRPPEPTSSARPPSADRPDTGSVSR